MSEPRKHHYVPQMLLNNFAGPNGRLRVLGIDHDGDFHAKPLKVGQTIGGHDRIGKERSTDRLTYETWMSNLEGAAAAEISAIRASSELTISPINYPNLPWLASLQHYRSRATMGYLKAKLSEEGGISNLELQTAILDVSVLPTLTAWQASKREGADPKETYDAVVAALRQFRWDVMRYRKPRLVVSDCFASQWGVSREHSNDFGSAGPFAKHGIGVPMHAAESFTIPLAPDLALHLHRGSDRKSIRAQEVNKRTIFGSRAFIAMPSSWTLPKPESGPLEGWIFTQRLLRGIMPEGL